jgi:hypothetical protein
MDHVDAHLATASQDSKYPLSIRAVLAIGKKTLNRYYTKTDHSEVYRIAMGMLSSFSCIVAFFQARKLTPFISPSPPSQVEVLQDCGMGGRMD